MKVALITAGLVLLKLICAGQTVVTSVPKKIYLKNEIIEVRYTLEAKEHIELKLARFIHKNNVIDTATRFQVSRGIAGSVGTKEGIKYSIVIERKIMPSHTGTFDLPICELQMSDTTIYSNLLSVKVKHKQMSRKQLLIEPYKTSGYVNVIIHCDSSKTSLRIVKDKFPTKITLKDTIKMKIDLRIDYNTAEQGYKYTDFFIDNFSLFETNSVAMMFGAEDFKKIDAMNLAYKTPPTPPFKQILHNGLTLIDKFYSVIPLSEGKAKVDLGTIEYAGKEYRLGAFNVRVLRD